MSISTAVPPAAPDWAGAPPPAWFSDAVATPSRVLELQVRGCRIVVREWGVYGAPGLMLVHGFAAHAHWWDFVAPFFHDAFHVAAVDLSGMGDSGHRTAYSLDLHVEEIVAACAAAGLDERTTVVGHSYGGVAGCLAVARNPRRFAGLVMVDSPVRLPGEAVARRRETFGHSEHNVYPSVAHALGRFRVVPAQPCEHPYILAYIARHSLREVAGGWMWKFDDRLFDVEPLSHIDRELDALADRLGFIYGERSQVVTAAHVRHVAALLGERAPVVGIAEADHHLFLNQPLTFVERLRELLAGMAADRGG
ncbi:MAG: alpha/beta hydrolase [Gammaproteobacteria bacterium]|nr:alpha/beta hydrolase [Gammaproteobacteria bacterium]